MGYAEAIKILRKKMLVMQTKLTDRFDVTFVSVNRWDNGMQGPTMKAQRKIAPLFEEYGIEIERNGFHVFCRAHKVSLEKAQLKEFDLPHDPLSE